ncbi:presenilin family intramembrane aspartyl protease, partial [Nanoarchaeota archaeon]
LDMKHELRVTIIIILIFLVTQIFGLYTINKQVDILPAGSIIPGTNDTTTKNIPIMNDPLSDQKLTREEGSTGLIIIVIAVALGTILLLTLVKFRQRRIWKMWYFLAVLLTMGITFKVYVEEWIPDIGIVIAVAFGLAFILSLLKLYKPNTYIHNITEVFMYTGIALVFLMYFTVFWFIMLLLLISIYDIIAVWKTKHMVDLAEFTIKSNLFAGFSIPYTPKHKAMKKLKKPKKPDKVKNSDKKSSKSIKYVKVEQKTAILGGGDVAFPLIFAGVVLAELRTFLQPTPAFLYSLIVIFFITLSLFGLFVFAKKDRYYPAMPFITAGCLIGYGILKLILLLV